MKKKLLSIILASTMAVGLLAGCGQDSSTVKSSAEKESEKSESVEKNSEVKEEPKEPIIISWYCQKPIAKMEQEEEVEEYINEIIYPQTGAKIDFHFIDSGSYDEKMNAMISAGEEFDICFSCSWLNVFYDNAVRGAFMDITDLLPQYAPDILAKSDDYVWDTVTIDGAIYGIPGQGAYAQTASIVIKKDLVEKYDFDYENVKTYEDFEPFFEQILENETGVTPVLVTANRGMASFADSKYTDDSITGLVFDEEKQEYVTWLEKEDAQEYREVLYDWYGKGYIPKDAIAKTDFSAEAKSGKYAVLPSTGSYSADGEKSTTMYGFDCVEILASTSCITNGGVTSQGNAISATSKHPEKALEVLNLVWKDPEISNTIAYGIEGINYVIDEERSTDEMKSIIPDAGDEQTWAFWHNWVGPLWDQWDSTWNRVEALEQMQQDNAMATAGSTLGFYFDNSSVKTEIAAVSSVLKEVKPVFSTGSMPDFDKYYEETKARLEEAGLEKIREEANRQFKEWKAKQ